VSTALTFGTSVTSALSGLLGSVVVPVAAAIAEVLRAAVVLRRLGEEVAMEGELGLEEFGQCLKGKKLIRRRCGPPS
jgi:hypothetical protein